MKTMEKGKLIVIDGTDGAGKETQTRLLVRALKKAGEKVKTLDFPQYHTKSAGLVENYLEGRYGDRASDVDPYVASVFYAVDRYDAAQVKLQKWLDDGAMVILDRYVSANMGHQGAKIKDPIEREQYFDWLFELEFEIFGIPKPDARFILYVDPEVGQKLADRKWTKAQHNLSKKDIHETDLSHLQQAAKVYRELADILPDTNLIECTEEGNMRSREDIHKEIMARINLLS
ncbi:dTMP kinase [Patescibacteria group bacterium]